MQCRAMDKPEARLGHATSPVWQAHHSLAVQGTKRRQTELIVPLNLPLKLPGGSLVCAMQMLLRSPPGEVEQAQQRERAVGPGAQPGATDESEEMGERPAVLAEGPKFHEIGAEDSVVDELDEAHGDADPEPLTARNLAPRIRNLEAKKEKRENKVLKQKQAIDEQYEFIEEQNRKLNTLVFELADTREVIAAIDAQIREASRMHS